MAGWFDETNPPSSDTRNRGIGGGGGGGGRRRAVAYCNVSRIGGGGSSVDSTRTYQVPAFRAVPLIGTS